MTVTEDNESAGIYNRVTLGVGVILLMAVFAVMGAVRLANREFERDMRNWEVRLGITADARYNAVQQWVDTQFTEMIAVADNVTVQLFMTEFDLKSDKQYLTEDEQGQVSFIRNYLIATAERTGFYSNISPQKIGANITQSGNAGIALLDAEGTPLVVTDGMPSMLERDANGNRSDFMRKSLAGQPQIKDIFLYNGTPLIAFSAPIYAIQGDEEGNAKQVGVVVGVKPAQGLYQALNKTQVMEKTTETLLVRESNDVVEYISPLADGRAPLTLKLSRDKRRKPSAAEFVIDNKGGFAVTDDYNSSKVLVTGRKINRTPWYLVHKVSRKEALAESDERKGSIIAIGVLIISTLVLIILAVWRHGSSVRYKHLADKFRSQERLLRLVSDNQPDAMYIVDKSLRYCFANQSAADDVRMSQDEMLGKSLRSVAGSIKADQCAEIIENVLEHGGVGSHIQRIEGEHGQVRVIQSKYIPLDRVPRILTSGVTPGVLVAEQDITQAISEKERRERLLNGLVDTLVSVVDSRDHYSADHSTQVAELAHSIASEMDLDEVMVETATIAAKLMNLGKIIMPRELLTKEGKYTTKEKKMILDARKASVEFIQGLEFNGPVSDTLNQVGEHWDGSGELGLKGDESIVTARIVSIANKYVAMTSDRSYRGKLSSEEALDILMEQIGKKYERRLVVALANYIENHS